MSQDAGASIGAAIRLSPQAASAMRDPRLLEAEAALIGDLLITVDAAGRVVFCNRGWQRLTGHPAGDAIGRHVWDVCLSGDDSLAVRAAFAVLVGGGDPGAQENWVETRSGQRRIRWRGTAVRAADGSVEFVVSGGRDVTGEYRTESLCRDRAEVLEMIARSEPLDRVVREIVEMVERHHTGARALLRVMDESAIGVCGLSTQDPLVISSDPVSSPTETADQVTAEWEQWIQPCEAGGGSWSAQIRSGQGEPLGTLALHAPDIRDPDHQVQSLLEDAARLASVAIEHAQLVDRLASQALHDPLTGLPNRLLLEQKLQRFLMRAHRDGTCAAVLVLDMDGFKAVNDMVGHQGADKALQLIAQRLQKATRPGDLLVRISGDEFTLVAPEVGNRDNAMLIARRLLDSLRAPLDVDGRELGVSISIGLAVYPLDGVDAETIQRNADIALRRAKHSGRNRCESFTPALSAEARERAELTADLRSAIERGQLQLHYQPKVDRAGQITGVEALLRWLHPQRGYVPPARFIPLAEEDGQILPIGAWVLNEVCRQAADWSNRLPLPPAIAANVSALQFAQQGFVQTLVESLRRHGTLPHLVELELTESLLMRDAGTGANKLLQVRRMGVGIAIDDFGTGYSSLSYLNRLPIDTLKIDRSFVSELSQIADLSSASPEGGDRQRTAVIRAITSLGNSLRLKLVAEGVETEAQRQFLLAIGCHEMQGFLFSPPLPAHEIEPLLRRVLPPVSPLVRSA
jgi:diguanylate cyclase (GGDEF)-like protein/PAS domain S-box-containing protein